MSQKDAAFTGLMIVAILELVSIVYLLAKLGWM